jgi:hypothetical protein
VVRPVVVLRINARGKVFEERSLGVYTQQKSLFLAVQPVKCDGGVTRSMSEMETDIEHEQHNARPPNGTKLSPIGSTTLSSLHTTRPRIKIQVKGHESNWSKDYDHRNCAAAWIHEMTAWRRRVWCYDGSHSLHAEIMPCPINKPAHFPTLYSTYKPSTT